MSKTEYAGLAIVAAISAFTGSVVVTQLVVEASPLQAATQRIDALEVRTLKVVDKEGRTRVSLDVEEGEPLLVMQTAAGEPRIALGADDSHGGLTLFRKSDSKFPALIVAEPGGQKVLWQVPEK